MDADADVYVVNGRVRKVQGYGRLYCAIAHAQSTRLATLLHEIPPDANPHTWEGYNILGLVCNRRLGPIYAGSFKKQYDAMLLRVLDAPQRLVWISELNVKMRHKQCSAMDIFIRQGMRMPVWFIVLLNFGWCPTPTQRAAMPSSLQHFFTLPEAEGFLDSSLPPGQKYKSYLGIDQLQKPAFLSDGSVHEYTTLRTQFQRNNFNALTGQHILSLAVYLPMEHKIEHFGP